MSDANRPDGTWVDLSDLLRKISQEDRNAGLDDRDPE
jgi:hypothetical protein